MVLSMQRKKGTDQLGGYCNKAIFFFAQNNSLYEQGFPMFDRSEVRFPYNKSERCLDFCLGVFH